MRVTPATLTRGSTTGRPSCTTSTSTTRASSTTASGWSTTSRPAMSKPKAEFSSTTQKTTSVLRLEISKFQKTASAVFDFFHRTLLTTGTSGKEEIGNTTQTFIWRHVEGSQIQIQMKSFLHHAKKEEKLL